MSSMNLVRFMEPCGIAALQAVVTRLTDHHSPDDDQRLP